MWASKKKVHLNDKNREQISDFYKKSDKYVRLLCFRMQLPPMITETDIYGQVYEKLCVYVANHELYEYGYQKLSQLLVKSARNEILAHLYMKNTTIFNINTNTEEECPFDRYLTSTNQAELDFEAEHSKVKNEKLKSNLFSCLTSNERKIMEEYYYNELNTSEIAKKYGCTPQNVSWVMNNAKKKIKKLWNTELIVR